MSDRTERGYIFINYLTSVILYALIYIIIITHTNNKMSITIDIVIKLII